MRAGRSGSVVCYTYRDPSPARSLKVYEGCSNFLRAFCEGEEDLDKFIISSIAGTMPLRAPGERGAIADDWWFSGISYEERKLRRRQMLSTTREKLLGWCDVFDRINSEGAVCVVANQEALQQCENLVVFDL